MIQRRDFLKAAGVSAASLGKPLVSNGEQSSASTSVPADTKYPKLAIKTRYSPQRLAFAASAGYEGVIVDVNEYFDPEKLTDSQTDQVLAAARDAGVRIISIESMVNHLAPDPAERRQIRARFVRCIELAHRLGCKFVGTFSGGKPGASVDEQAKELAEVLNEQYLPICEKLDVTIGPENIASGWNSILPIWCGNTSTPSRRPGTFATGSSLCMPRTRKSFSRFSPKSASTAEAGGVTAFPDRG